MSKQIVKKQENPVAARPEPSPGLLEAIGEVKENLESVESFTLPRIKMSAGGMELLEGEPLAQEITGTIIHTRKINQYYAKPYDPNDITPPDCFSTDGEKPDPSIEKPVSESCKACPMAEFGSNNRKSGKACRNLKPLYLVLDGALMPRQLTIAPTSLKAANSYLMNLTERGLAYRKVKTKIEAFKDNAKDTYCKLRFSMVEKLTPQQIADTEFLKANWLPIMEAQKLEREAEGSEPSAAPQEAKGEF